MINDHYNYIITHCFCSQFVWYDIILTVFVPSLYDMTSYSPAMNIGTQERATITMLLLIVIQALYLVANTIAIKRSIVSGRRVIIKELLRWFALKEVDLAMQLRFYLWIMNDNYWQFNIERLIFAILATYVMTLILIVYTTQKSSTWFSLVTPTNFLETMPSPLIIPTIARATSPIEIFNINIPWQ